jgi:hypothetical protein
LRTTPKKSYNTFGDKEMVTISKHGKVVSFMAKKKMTRISVSQEENVQAQHIFEQYHEIANSLRATQDQGQAETALAEVNSLPESTQVALLHQLSKEQQVDAADVLIAINEMSPLKSVRKEARRSLLRLESAKIYPSWEPPIDRSPAINAVQPLIHPPRFWQGIAEGTRTTSSVQLLLLWEQGEDYKEVRILGLYLEFRREGIKECFTNLVDSKRTAEKFLAEIKAKMEDVAWRNCELVEVHRLLRSALAVHARRGTKPPAEYQAHVPLINQLILEAEEAAFDEESSDPYNFDAMHVVGTFVNVWAEQDYDLAYDFLSEDSALREGLSREDWIKRRETWAAEAAPNDFEPSYIYERKQHKSQLWLPGSFNMSYAATYKEIETGWSIEMVDTPANETLPELPRATLIYEESNRHWFWASYTLVQEHGAWRIQSMTDEGMIAPNFSVDDLEDELDELSEQLGAITDKYTLAEVEKLKDEVAKTHFQELLTRVMQTIYFIDVLIKKLPFDQSNYEFAARRMAALGHHERCLAYLTPMIRRFPHKRALYLRQKAHVEQRLSEDYSEQDNDERAEHYDALARQSMREALAIEDTFEVRVFLAELLVGNDEVDEAEEHLLQAKKQLADLEENTLRHGRIVVDARGEEILLAEEEGDIEYHLGEIADLREDYADALSHYQRAAELLPDVANAWYAVGTAHRELEHFEEAEGSFKRAIELDPEKAGYYNTLSKLYADNEQFSEAIQILEEGLAANPDSAFLHVAMAALYTDMGNLRQAETFMHKAERLNPESPSLHALRGAFNKKKLEQKQFANQFSKPVKHKKGR